MLGNPRPATTTVTGTVASFIFHSLVGYPIRVKSQPIAWIQFLPLSMIAIFKEFHTYSLHHNCPHLASDCRSRHYKFWFANGQVPQCPRTFAHKSHTDLNWHSSRFQCWSCNLHRMSQCRNHRTLGSKCLLWKHLGLQKECSHVWWTRLHRWVTLWRVRQAMLWWHSTCLRGEESLMWFITNGKSVRLFTF
jgi:hypothetical protein